MKTNRVLYNWASRECDNLVKALTNIKIHQEDTDENPRCLVLGDIQAINRLKCKLEKELL